MRGDHIETSQLFGLQWDDREFTELNEVFVKGQGKRDAQSLHHGKGNGIGEGEVLVGVTEDDFACAPFIFFCGANNMNTVPHALKPSRCYIAT